MRKPDEYIGGIYNPYMRRWWLFKRRAEWIKIYLHNLLRDDEDRALHDHPAHSVSIILWGGYIEHFPRGVKKNRRPGMIVFRRAEQAHRIELYRDDEGNPVSAWSIFIMGRKTREWGFHCPNGWRHWRIFCDPKDKGMVGRGCD